MHVFIRWPLTAVALVGLGIDAYTHLDLASEYDLNRTDVVSQGTLFRIEAVLAIVVGVLLIFRATLWTALAVVAVAGGGLFLVMLYRWVDIGKLGPLPPMYEPVWYPEKSWSAVGEAMAFGSGLLLAGLTWPRRGRASRRVATYDASGHL